MWGPKLTAVFVLNARWFNSHYTHYLVCSCSIRSGLYSDSYTSLSGLRIAQALTALTLSQLKEKLLGLEYTAWTQLTDFAI